MDLSRCCQAGNLKRAMVAETVEPMRDNGRPKSDDGGNFDNVRVNQFGNNAEYTVEPMRDNGGDRKSDGYQSNNIILNQQGTNAEYTAALYREAMKAQGNHLPKSSAHKCNNVTLMNSQGEGTGNSRAYSLARVKVPPMTTAP